MMTQEEALSILKTGANVFLTGEPGSGKTYTVNSYISWLKDRGIEPAITASTGIAATHIGGYTIHAWSGIGIKDTLSSYELDALSQNERLVKRVRSTPVLIIDEVSMLHHRTLDTVDAVLKSLRGSSRPFGGMQVVLVGDFFQLPPIEKRVQQVYDEYNQDTNMFDGMFEDEAPKSSFAFESMAWKNMKLLTCYLSQQFRQEDPTFLDLLLSIRTNTIQKHHTELLSKRVAKPSSAVVTRLYTHNMDVDRINDVELKKVDGTAKVFIMSEYGSPPVIQSLKRGCLSPEKLMLKVGAKVMFTKNSPQGDFVNGTIGEVSGFDVTGYPIVTDIHGKSVTAKPMDWQLENNGKLIGSISQVPLRLAWAITIHKSQGMSLDAAHMDLRNVFEFGQGYVALSRVRTLNGVTLDGISQKALQIHPAVASVDADFRRLSSEASETFANMDTSDIESLHKSFVIGVGGSWSSSKTLVKPGPVGKRSVYSYQDTAQLVLEKKPLSDIVTASGYTVGTIISHIQKCLDLKSITHKNIQYLITVDSQSVQKVQKSLKRYPDTLKPVFDSLDGKVSYDDIKLIKLAYTD
jgi:ATP-dependent DNA helicase PIF1